MELHFACETAEYRGMRLRKDPAREDCFRTVHQHYEVYMPTKEAPSEPTGLEQLHSNANSELLSLEIFAQSLAEFPQAPWELRMQMARAAWDETRHARMLFGRFRELGGRKGQFPIINHEYTVVCLFDSLAARLCVQNRTFEAGSVDSFHQIKKFWEQRGDPRTAAIFDVIMTDEVSHVRFGNEWVQRLVKDEPRNALRIAQAMAYVKRAVQVLATQPGEVIVDGRDLAAMKHDVPLQAQDRRDAGFTEDDIAELGRRDVAFQRLEDG